MINKLVYYELFSTSHYRLPDLPSTSTLQTPRFPRPPSTNPAPFTSVHSHRRIPLPLPSLSPLSRLVPSLKPPTQTSALARYTPPPLSLLHTGSPPVNHRQVGGTNSHLRSTHTGRKWAELRGVIYRSLPHLVSPATSQTDDHTGSQTHSRRRLTNRLTQIAVT